MRWKRGDSGTNMIVRMLLLFVTLSISTCDGARRQAQRRKDTSRSAELYIPEPSAESIQVIAQAMGAAGFEHYTEGRALVKRLIPADSQPDLDVVEHQGVIGKAGVDFPAYPNIPATGFNCKNVLTGYYADLETDCQVFHICDTSRKISFLCPNGTIFSQSHLICDWWFKVDCASAPALYESSAEYYSNEQKKTQKITQTLTKNADLQQIGTDTNIRAESRRTSVNVPSTTERFLRHRQRLQGDAQLNSSKATARSFQSLFETSNYNPTQRTQATTAFEKRKKNLVQLIANNFGNVPAKSTSPTYSDGPVYRPTTASPPYDYNSIREMQVAAESASFAANKNNRQFLQDYNSKNFRPYPVYTPNVPSRPQKPKSNPNLTTLYDFRDRHLAQVNYKPEESTTKRTTLVPYSKTYSTTPAHSKHDPYTRPGVSLLKDFLEKEKNKTVVTSTETNSHATDRSDLYETKENLGNKIIIDTKNSFESATKIPQTTKSLHSFATETASSQRLESYTSQVTQVTTEPYQERRDRLIRKLNLGIVGSTPITEPTPTEKYYGDLPNRPGLIVPPSLTPKTLHSLAIYYATALDNLSTGSTPEETEATTQAFDEYEPIDEELPGLFSHHTINKYSSLFGHGSNNGELLEDLKLDPNGTYNELVDDLSVQQSQNPIATSPQIRELAQVFTHALSAYLQDPVQFRKVLSDIRPTHPTFTDVSTDESLNTEPTTTVNEEDEEILGFSDDIKSRPSLISLRDSKALNLATDYPSISEEPRTTPKAHSAEAVSAAYSNLTPRSPFRCCARISASYTSPSTPIVVTTPLPYSNTVAAKVNTLVNDIYNEKIIATTENSYAVPKYGGFQNNTLSYNDSPYGTGVSPTNSQPLSEYIEATNLPTAWGVDASESTATSTIATPVNIFESKKIRASTFIPETTPVYFTETDSVELENEEELQRAHSQSFIGPQSNSLRQGKQVQFDASNTTVRKPSEDLEAPTLPNSETTTAQTTAQPTTTFKIEETEATTTLSPISSSIFTSPDSDKTTNQFQWPSTFEAWHSTVIDPITLNDGLSPSGPEESSQLAKQTNTWVASTTAIPTTEYTATSEQSVSSTSINIDVSSLGQRNDERFGRLLRDPSPTEPSQDLSAITDTVVEKAKEIMGGMNATTTEKLMNVMKKTKSKTVRRLILLLVQTCDDDHNTTAEASKKALLEALMAVSQKDMEEIAKEEEQSTEIQTTTSDYETARSTDYRRTDRFEDRQEERPRHTDRRGKSLNVEASAVNSLSNPSTTEAAKTTTDAVVETTVPSRTTQVNRRGAKKFFIRTTTTTTAEPQGTTPFVDSPRAEARVASQPQVSDPKGTSDTRALELLRSLYTIAARWG